MIRIPKWLPRDMSSAEAWILPDGRFVSVHRPDQGLDHADTAKMILGPTGELEAERQGWLRISDYGDRTTQPLTQGQLDTLFDYCTAQGSDFKEALENIKFLNASA
jgi:hypothetical protein